jgi:signal transduction histidine kinase
MVKSIKNRIILQISFLVTLIIILLIISIGLIILKSMKDESQKTLHNRALSVESRIETRLQYLVNNCIVLSKNDLMINALIDADGRKEYLTPLAKNFMDDKNVVYLNIVDFDGKIIFKTSENIPKYSESKYLRRTLAMGNVIKYIKDNVLTVMVPMKYYNTTQGALIVTFNLNDILNKYLSKVNHEYIKVISNEKLFYSLNFYPDKKYYSYILEPNINSFLYSLNIKLEMGIWEDVYLSPIRNAIYKLIFVALFLLVIGVFISYYFAISITNPILKLYNRINENAYKDKYEPLGTNDELEILSKAFYDNTQQLIKMKEDELDKQQLLAQQSKMASMGEMIGNIAHQWRQPLSVISTGATGLKISKEYNTLTDENFIEICDSINDNAQYLSKTIDDFRDFVKGERKLEEFNLSDDIESFLHLVEGTIKSNNIHLIQNLQNDIIINGYSNELIQCFINIFNNAKDALKEVNTQRYYFISTFIKDDNVIIVFRDNAGGIPENVLPQIFEPYFTTKHKSKGTGLGLSMSYKLIEEGMNGTIEADNVTYEYNDKNYTGAEFVIKLPLNSVKKKS